VDGKDSPGRGTPAFYDNPDAAGTILGVESIHGTVGAGAPFAGITVQGLVKQGQTVG